MWCFCHFHFEFCFPLQRRELFPALQPFFNGPNIWFCSHFDFEICFPFSTSQLPKMLQAWGVFTFGLGNVLRATMVRTFSTSQSPKAFRTCGVFWHVDFDICFAPQWRVNFQKCSGNSVCFAHFDFEMCFAPQPRAFFQLQHLNFQKCSEHNFLYVLIWKCASRHNGVQPQRRASFNFSYDQIIPDSQMAPRPSLSRLFYLLARLDLLSSKSFSSLIFFIFPFSSLTRPTFPFAFVHTVGSLTSKLPSIKISRRLPDCIKKTTQISYLYLNQDMSKANSKHSKTVVLCGMAGQLIERCRP